MQEIFEGGIVIFNLQKKVIVLIMATTFISGIFPNVNAYAATSDLSKSQKNSSLENKSSKVKEKENNTEENKSEEKDSQKNNLKKDKLSESDSKEQDLKEDADEVLDEEKAPEPGWHVINGKRFYFTEDGMLEKKGWFEIDEYIYRGTESSPKVYEPILKKKEQTNSKVNKNKKDKAKDKTDLKFEDKIEDKESKKNNTIIKDSEKIEEDKQEKDENNALENNEQNDDIDSNSTSSKKDEYEVVDPSKDPNYVLHKNTYYFNDDHSVAIGWKDFSGKWYNFNEYGAMRTDWNYIDYKWYYLDERGEMQRGWLEVGSNKYYLYSTGEMASGKMNIDDKWYYFNGSGILQTGFYTKDGKQCYSNKNGEMLSNEWIENNDKKYYVKANGELAIGNIIIDGEGESFTDSGLYKGGGKIDEYLYVEYLDVGNADCIFIKLPNGETALIDTGLNTKDSENKVIDFLENQNMKEDKDDKKIINHVIITHPHSDHIGGLYKILKNFNVEKIYMPERSYLEDCLDLEESGSESGDIKIMKEDYRVFKKTMDLIEDLDIEVINAVKGQDIDEDGILKFVNRDVYYAKPLDERVSANYWEINNQSAVVYLNYNDLGALFTGDIEWLAEKDIIESDLLAHSKVDVLKVPHHGINTSSSYAFVNYVGADIGIIPRETNQIMKNGAYTNLITGRVTLFETGLKDGVSLYATKDGWNVQY
ncbi:MBL fold metallo-hydrolase [Clostridium botulinum]|uniref:MBL fold metallo-hydrolase n=1 Tax=Clostridium botulinum TaxID=1491 RepID=UPI0013FFAFE8|nr:MBL fold metallo-hydrolase [Clostridium botulinum]MBY6914970.1 MBL fold metallo-hydrolase [Clostridium botulinum]NFO38722.1 MBL fold metallo-hydrolase [Clostridium botulinum]NFQ40106.1 MBL fold metallo-hydrolase [Clostridium botulinum]